MEELVEISKDRLDELIEAENFLTALIEAGVDNWSGYSVAQEMLERIQNND